MIPLFDQRAPSTKNDCVPTDIDTLPKRDILETLQRFVGWLNHYGEVSYDFQTFYANRVGQSAKALYYKRPVLGILAVAPIIFCEAFVPAAKRLFYKPQRFPIADAHYAMGFFFLSAILNDPKYYKRGLTFLESLEQTKCPHYDTYCWGYPFDWVTIRGTVHAGTPLITTVPYVYEAFMQAYQTDGNDRWLRIMRSTAQHVFEDYRDVETSAAASTCTYTPASENSVGVTNANAYRAFLLTSAGLQFSEENYLKVAQRNLNFVLESQNPDGSWYYAYDGVRSFIDHYHTCFVLKALVKIEMLTGNHNCTQAIERGIAYYVKRLFDDKGLPRPFSRPPRLIVYRRELYDFAECVNLGALVHGRFPQLDELVSGVVKHLMTVWQRPNGSFRSRRLHLGWDNTPMHRWAQAQMFRSLCFLISR